MRIAWAVEFLRVDHRRGRRPIASPGVKVGRLGADMVKVTPSRCPHCSALLTRGVDWCSLCLTDLRPAPEPAVVVAPVALGSDLSTAVGVDSDSIAEVLVAPTRPRGKHARRPEGSVMELDVPDADVDSDAPTGLAASLMAIREATSLDPSAPAPASPAAAAPRLDIDDIDLSVLAGAGSPSTINEWSLKAQAPGAKVGLMVAGVAVVGGVALLLLTLAGLVLR